ncbi:MAG: hypothetical protein N5P05_002180 [Chroococcopsis gigantea SAG 12.99]|jgi:predicted PurR-regulated permease PerM|nr:AI-2E family transporter [Chlorogloea purpurea SAG 13.99]MDV3000574.1 hypothetical protein [Chroococcopsis gigantea SAG 12.99]
MTFYTALASVILLICLWVVWQIRKLLLLLFLAIIIADTLNIFVVWLEKRGIKRERGILVSIGLLLSMVVGSFGLIIPSFVKQFQQLSRLLPLGLEKLADGIDNFIEQLTYRLDWNILQSLPDTKTLLSQLQPLFHQVAGKGLSVFYSTFGVVLGLLLLLALSLMIFLDTKNYYKVLIRLFPSFYRRRAGEILQKCDRSLHGWLKGVVFHAVLMIFSSWLGLSLLGIPLAFTAAAISGVLTFIPNIGPVLSVIAPLGIGVLEEPWKPWAVLILYLGIQIIICYFDRYPLYPGLAIRTIPLLPGFILLSQIFFANLFGFLGLFLAVPLLIVTQIFISEIVIKDLLDRLN